MTRLDPLGTRTDSGLAGSMMLSLWGIFQVSRVPDEASFGFQLRWDGCYY